MGTLVFQATLGGSVNLIGPNIAGTVNFTLPSADGTSGQALATNGSGTLAFSSFATLTSNTFSGSQTLSAGTANGVTYLNGSKVLTSGSALTFDGTNFASTGSLTGSTLKTTRASGSQPEVVLTQTSVASWSIYNPPSSTDLRFYNGSDLLTLNSSGNLGLGVTPSAQYSTVRALQIGQGAILQGQTNGPYMSVGANFYLDSSATYRYTSTDFASRYTQAVGTHYWYNAPSGTAGNAITFTQAMTLDASGNLGVGTTSPLARFDAKFATDKHAVFTASSGYSNGADLIALNDAGSEIALGLAGSTVRLYTSATERARIDSSGNFLVGKTSTGTANIGWEWYATGGGRTSMAASTNATTTNEIYSTGASAYRFYVGMGGTVFATSIVISAISDQRLKENVRDIDTGLDAIMALQPRRFDWKEGKGQDKKNVAGFIAQEFETVFPECVSTSKAGEDGIEYKNINHETLIPTLVKAIQEQQAIIESLKARLDAANI